MATAVHPRSTPAAGLTPSQAQNSAPVFEYRCMFTHDIRKKAKKWHDGSLRFHTFNRRVMVYDDTKSLVGSLHYRAQDEFAEGLELNLDSHVLVQVEERLGESSTDLTPLLSRQRQDGDNNFVKPDPPTRATLSRINAANSQIKPKSIKELLSGSQGTIGRARLPIQSPYEQRQPLVGIYSSDPQPKRRKLIHGKENDVEVTERPKLATERRAPIAEVQSMPQNKVVDISSDDAPDSPPPQQENSSKTRPTPPRPIEKIRPHQVVRDATSSRSQPPSRAKPKQRRRDSLDNDVGLPPRPRKEHDPEVFREIHQRPTEIASIERPPAASVIPRSRIAIPVVAPIRHSTGPRSSLKFATERPRPRLMYRALLSDSSRPASGESITAATGESTKSTTPDRGSNDGHPARRSRHTNLIDTDKLFAPSQIGRVIAALDVEPSEHASPSDEHPSPNPMDIDIDHPTPRSVDQESVVSTPEADDAETVPDSPMFLPRTASQLSSSPSQEMAGDDSHVSLLSQAVWTTRANLALDEGLDVVPSTQTAASRHSNSNPLSDPSSSPVFHRLRLASPHTERPVSIAQSPKSGERDNNHRSPSPRAHSVTLPTPSRALPAQGRLFRRVVSESVQRTHGTPDSLPGDSDSYDGLSATPEDKVQETTPHKPRTPLVQPHSFSDPVEPRPASPTPSLALSSPSIDDVPQQLAADKPHVNPDSPSIPPEVSGPWTTTEAFLLFDWWPPGREKPPYAENVSTTANGSTGRGDMRGTTRTEQLTVNTMSKKKYGTFGSAKFVSQR